jgi:transposase
MMGLPSGIRIWLATGATDMRKGFDGLASLVQTVLDEDPISERLAKVLRWSGDGYCLFSKRLDRGTYGHRPRQARR